MVQHCRIDRHVPAWDCNHCDDLYSDRKSFDYHIIRDHNHPCEICGVVCSSPGELAQHRQEYHTHYCTPCERWFHFETGLNQHNQAIHRLKCDLCLFTSHDEAEMEMHDIESHKFPCSSCPDRAAFRSVEALQAHRESSVHNIPCPKCKETFWNVPSKDDHFASAHVFQCQWCRCKFDNKNLRQAHVASNHTIRCPKCGHIAPSELALQAHIKEIHGFKNPQRDQTSMTAASQAKELAQSHSSKATKTIKTAVKPQLLPAAKTTKIALLCPTCDASCDSPASLISHYFESHVHENHNITIPTLATSHCQSQDETSGLHASSAMSAEGPVVDTEESTPSVSMSNAAVQTPVCRCEACDVSFDNAAALQSHFQNSAFHQPRPLSCTECKVYHNFSNQIELLEHIESKPHKTRWILTMI